MLYSIIPKFIGNKIFLKEVTKIFGGFNIKILEDFKKIVTLAQ
jgi:hypothetical protein